MATKIKLGRPKKYDFTKLKKANGLHLIATEKNQPDKAFIIMLS